MELSRPSAVFSCADQISPFGSPCVFHLAVTSRGVLREAGRGLILPRSRYEGRGRRFLLRRLLLPSRPSSPDGQGPKP